ncbi:unnamed protein product [Phytophthora fragariaefolia]|uniref:Unnamed protein product n=1 Tax=Phytophthora fragariaefolia TaxID=1490495 RepID=A0A9W7D0L3_9STRA|nr:unnamed protein product [Phytophthora fragariaefolia]
MILLDKDYTSKFMLLLSQSSMELPEMAKRWFYQQNLRGDTSCHISQNNPKTLQAAIEHAQRFEDARSTRPRDTVQPVQPAGNKKPGRASTAPTTRPTTDPTKPPIICHRCGEPGHIAPACPNRGTTGMQKKQMPTIWSHSVSTFVDCGASFNAITPQLVEKLGLVVKDYIKPVSIRVGGGKEFVILRKVVTFKCRIPGFSPYASRALVMEVPENKDVLLGMPWVITMNPDIDWAARTISSRNSSAVLAFCQCVPVQAAARIGGRRTRCSTASKGLSNTEVLRYYRQYDYNSAHGSTRSPSKAQLAWEALRSSPAYLLLCKFKSELFREELPSVPPVREGLMEASIELTDDTPVHRKQFPLSAAQKEAIRLWTQEMLAAQIIRKTASPYCSPTFCVRKCSEKWRIVHDLRGLNVKMRVPANPTPRKEEIYRAMANSKRFSAMDLLWGFYQVGLREDSIPYTAFSTPDGLYEYLVTPMGVSSSPSCFNRLVQAVFSDQQSFCQTYFDNIFVFTPTDSVEEHITALEKVVQRCVDQRRYIKLSKCKFCADEIPCLRDFIGRAGVRMAQPNAVSSRTGQCPAQNTSSNHFSGPASTFFGSVVIPPLSLHHSQNSPRDISIDFMASLPTTSTGCDAVMVIVDRLTKRALLIPTSTQASTLDTTKLFCSAYQPLHGLPRSIVSDRDSTFTVMGHTHNSEEEATLANPGPITFTSKFWAGIMKLQNSGLHLSTAFRPSTDGQSDVTNIFIIEYLRHFLEPHQTDWDSYLPLGEFAYNSRAHSTTGMAPFVADLGYLPRSVGDLALNTNLDVTRPASRFVEHQSAILTAAQDAMATAQRSWHRYYDRNHPAVAFTVNDKGLLDTKNLVIAHTGSAYLGRDLSDHTASRLSPATIPTA